MLLTPVWKLSNSSRLWNTRKSNHGRQDSDPTLLSQRHANEHRTRTLKQPSPLGRTGSLTYIPYLLLKWSFKLTLDWKSEDLLSSSKSPHIFTFLSISLISSSFSVSGGPDPHLYLMIQPHQPVFVGRWEHTAISCLSSDSPWKGSLFLLPFSFYFSSKMLFWSHFFFENCFHNSSLLKLPRS